MTPRSRGGEGGGEGKGREEESLLVCSLLQVKRKAIADELNRFLSAEPVCALPSQILVDTHTQPPPPPLPHTQAHPSKLFMDEIMTVQRVLKTKGFVVTESEVRSYTST